MTTVRMANAEDAGVDLSGENGDGRKHAAVPIGRLRPHTGRNRAAGRHAWHSDRAYAQTNRQIAKKKGHSRCGNA